MSGHLTIISCGLGPANLTDEHKNAVKNADLLAGGKRLLDWFPEFSGRKVEIGVHAKQTAEELAESAKTDNVAVLASGDSLFFGIGRMFSELVPNENMTIMPNVTAAQAAFSKLHLPWESFSFFSVHGRDKQLPWRRVLQSEQAVIYCDSKRNPAATAAALIKHFPACGSRKAAIAKDLGADETLWQGTLSEAASLEIGGMSMLIILGSDNAAANPSIPLGLDDATYEHERNMITHPEVRAIILSKLQLRPGILWDLGAGSGSVSVEAASICSGLSVYAVEQKEERHSHIVKNAESAGCHDYNAKLGDILETLPSLPAPDAVFIGGGGNDIREIAASAYDKLSSSGTMVISAIREETRTDVLNAIPDAECEVIEIAIRRSASLGSGTMMKPDNPITLFIFRKA